MARLSESANLLNITIPVQPISYDDAHELMQYMKGAQNNRFMGSLGSDMYRIGPGYGKPRENW